jgi:ATP-dependent Clp endopeptidase proteolytic subunit ClpP
MLLRAPGAPASRCDDARQRFNRGDHPAGSWYSVRATAGSSEVLIYEEIGSYGVSAKQFVADLAAISETNLTVRINSPGGDVYDGIAIYNALASRKGTVTCQIDGLAASAASFIAMAGDTVTAHSSAMLMIHKAWGLAIGNDDDMRSTADLLTKIDGQIADLYAARSGKTSAAIMKLMVAETWFTADEAKAAGLVDEVIGADGKENRRNRTAAANANAASRDRRLRLATAGMSDDERVDAEVASLRRARAGARGRK